MNPALIPTLVTNENPLLFVMGETREPEPAYIQYLPSGSCFIGQVGQRFP